MCNVKLWQFVQCCYVHPAVNLLFCWLLLQTPIHESNVFMWDFFILTMKAFNPTQNYSFCWYYRWQHRTEWMCHMDGWMDLSTCIIACINIIHYITYTLYLYHDWDLSYLPLPLFGSLSKLFPLCHFTQVYKYASQFSSFIW